MTYVGETGEITGVIRPNGIDTLQMRESVAVSFLATGALTDGEFGLFRWNMTPDAGGPGAHFHRTFSESFYVLSGTVTVYDGKAWVDGNPGDFFYVPKGGIHGFRNDSGKDASMLILFAPAPPREKFFTELAEIHRSARLLSPDEWADFYARHDQVNL
ncbi:MAG: cupin domain-containing protein [Micromonosporaceae bacterium]